VHGMHGATGPAPAHVAVAQSDLFLVWGGDFYRSAQARALHMDLLGSLFGMGCNWQC
jgi:hypothetical protein